VDILNGLNEKRKKRYSGFDAKGVFGENAEFIMTETVESFKQKMQNEI